MDFQCVTEEFFDHCARKGLSDHTLRAYRQDLRDFRTWLTRAGELEPLHRDTIVEWIADLRQRELAPASIRRRLACLKVLCRWLEDEERIEQSPFHRLRTPIQIPKRLPRNLSPQELKSLFDQAARPDRAASPDIQHATLRLALELMFGTGIRVGELCAIRLDDLDPERGSIRIAGKGNRERRVFLPDPRLRNLLNEYVALRDTTNPTTNRLLITRHGTAVRPDYIRRRLRKLSEDAKLDRRVTPHMLRHSAATQLLESGVDIRFVQKLLGHSSISTTEIYTHVSDSALRTAICQANPRQRLE